MHNAIRIIASSFGEVTAMQSLLLRHGFENNCVVIQQFSTRVSQRADICKQAQQHGNIVSHRKYEDEHSHFLPLHTAEYISSLSRHEARQSSFLSRIGNLYNNYNTHTHTHKDLARTRKPRLTTTMSPTRMMRTPSGRSENPVTEQQGVGLITLHASASCQTLQC
jgi:hypothetical protein